MRWSPLLLLGLCVQLGAAERPATAPIAGDDLAELEQLKQKLRTDDPVPAAPKPATTPPATKGGMSPEDLAELEALRSRIKSQTPEAPPAPMVLVQLIRSEIEGLELVLVLDVPIPTPVVIQGSGHTIGQKFTVQGTYSGAAKFEGAYYPLLKSAQPVVNAFAEPSKDEEPSAMRPVLGAGAAESEEGFGGFQLSNILFAGFAAISLAIVALKAKAKFAAWKGKKSRR
jgi:hypothetical protein